MRLYHYTSMSHLPRIMSRGALLLTESNISGQRMHAGPPVVWFTSHANPDKGHGLNSVPDEIRQVKDFAEIDKTRVRITVELPKRRVTKFVNWSKAQGISPHWLAELATMGGLYSWWVSTQIVAMDKWVEIRDLQDTSKDPEGRLIWFRREDGQMSTQVDFRQLLEKHGRAIPKDAKREKIRRKTKPKKAGKK